MSFSWMWCTITSITNIHQISHQIHWFVFILSEKCINEKIILLDSVWHTWSQQIFVLFVVFFYLTSIKMRNDYKNAWRCKQMTLHYILKNIFAWNRFPFTIFFLWMNRIHQNLHTRFVYWTFKYVQQRSLVRSFV